MTSVEPTSSLQIWHNAAFDDGHSQVPSAIKPSWSNLPRDLTNQSFDSDGSKENHIPISVSSSLQSSSSSVTDQLGSSEVQEKPRRAWCEAPSAKSTTLKAKYGADQRKRRDDREIDAEIQEVEKEISRLSTRLESLHLQKAEQTARSVALRGRIVPAKFMDPSFQGPKSRTSTRRGVSLGPGEIYSAANRTETPTPLQSTQSRRNSCFWKLPGIEEGKETKGRGRVSMSLSPRSRKAALKIKQAATTAGCKRAVKKEEGLLSSIQPKKLFKDEEKAVASRKSLKPGRVVASRYSLISKTQAEEKDARKRSFPENEEKENHRSEKRRASDENSKNEKSVGRVKKTWEIPNQVVAYRSGVNEETPIGKELPKIRTLRRAAESPRDSGAAKRVADLEGNERSFSTFCLSLRFEE